MPWVLAIDLGNGGPKVAAVDPGGSIGPTAQREVSVDIGIDGTAAQDASEWWTALGEAVREVAGQMDASDLVAIGITGQWGSTVPVDERGEPVGPVLLWADTRARRYMKEVIGGPVTVQGFAPEKVLPWIRMTGGAPTPSGADPTGHSLLLQHDFPEVYARSRWLMEPVDYLGMRFTGRAAATPASMILSWLTDNHIDAAPRYVDSLVRKAKRDPHRLPPLVTTGTVLGPVLPDVAEQMGLPPGVPVVCGLPDLHSAVLGSGAIEPFATHIAVSTTAWISSRVPLKKTDILHSMASVPGFDSRLPMVANNQEIGGGALRWLREQVIDADFGALTAEAATAPPGCEGALFAPWLNGERSPVEDKDVRGAFVGLSLRTDRAMMIRSVMEGVALNARWLFDTYEKFCKRRIDSVRILGGGAQSSLWCSIYAGVLDRRVEQVANPRDAQLVGAALWALVSLGEMTLPEAASRVRVAEVFEPGDCHRDVYQEAYAEYRGLYKRLKGLRTPAR
ncbi:MAG: xylulokinase [Candidatus Nanopelagicales bacterium]